MENQMLAAPDNSEAIRTMCEAEEKAEKLFELAVAEELAAWEFAED